MTPCEVLSQIYTQTLGDWALWLFYAGAVVTLYGTIFASTAAHSRLFADAMRIGGVYLRDDTRSRRRWRNRFLVALSVLPAVFYWFIESPVQMVLAGGLAQSALLPLIGIAALYLRHTRLPADIRPSIATTIMLWIATVVMIGFALYYVGARAACCSRLATTALADAPARRRSRSGTPVRRAPAGCPEEFEASPLPSGRAGR